MLRTTSFTGKLTILQSLINAANENEVGRYKSGGNETILSNLFASKKFTKAGYPISKNAKKGGKNPKKNGNNTKKDVIAAKNFNYLTSNAKKAFNYLRHAFIQALIL